MKKKGRTFSCQGCPEATQRLRRCREDNWDFTAKDGNIFPIQIQEGGGLYGFCPAKVTWDQEAIGLFELMIVAVEMKKLLADGGLAEQPHWFTSNLAWFAPTYDTLKFVSRVKMVMGGEDSTTPAVKGKRK